MTNKKLLFIWNYHYFPFEKGKSRFSDLLDAFVKEGYQVEVITSSFYHMGKVQRDIADPKYQSFDYKVTFVKEPGYRKNVSFARIRSMNRFNAGVKKILKTHEPVDVVYIPVPSIKLAAIGEKWCKKVGAKSVIDVEDLWPESFQMVIKPKFLYQVLTWPLQIRANKVYRKASAVVAVSQTYLRRVTRSRRDDFPNVVAPIGADLDFVSSAVTSGSIVKPKGEFWVAYIGTLGKSYNLKTIIDAIHVLYEKGRTNIVLKIMGSGPEEANLKKYVSGKKGRFDFLGLLPYERMCQVLSASDVGVNPIVLGSVASLINKVADYAACGVPVINTQDCYEYQEMLDLTQSGVSIPDGQVSLMSGLLQRLQSDPKLLANFRNNVPLLAQGYFSRKKSETFILFLVGRLIEGVCP